ncbi:MAG: hypothetical protein ACR2QM_12080 [Longimicrobiales bacterium]
MRTTSALLLAVAVSVAAAVSVAFSSPPAQPRSEGSLSTQAPPAAEVPSAESPMYEYFVEVGLLRTMEEERVLGIERQRALLDRALGQMSSQLGAIPLEAQQELARLSKQAMDEMLSAYTSEELLRVYASGFDKYYPGSEIDAAIEQLSSPSGRRLSSAVNEATSGTYAFRAAREQAALDRAIKAYSEGLKSLLQGLRSQL